MNACRNGTTISFVDEKNIDSCHRTIRQSDGTIRRFVGVIRSFDRIIRHFVGTIRRFDEIIRRFDGIIRRFEVNYLQFRRELSAVLTKL